MVLVQTSPPAEEPVSIADLKAHLRVTSTSEDALISGLGLAARRTIEARTSLALIAQNWRLSVDGPFPSDVTLPLGPVSAVTTVAVTQNGASVALSSDQFVVETGSVGRVAVTAAITADAGYGALTIDFTAGWVNAAAVPDDIALAVKMLTAHFFEHREAVGSDRYLTVPDGVATLLAPYKRVRL
ncbi:MAG: head-tail connector protein [Pseudomonadota bacterium]